jgi:hypothetical protein
MTQTDLSVLGLAGLATAALVTRIFYPSIGQMISANIESTWTISLKSAARAVILHPLSLWAAMAAHSDEVFRLGL